MLGIGTGGDAQVRRAVTELWTGQKVGEERSEVPGDADGGIICQTCQFARRAKLRGAQG